MTLGVADRQGDLYDDVAVFCEKTLPERSIYVLLARGRDRLFPDEAFADLFTDRGRRSVPPSQVAAVMVLQRLEGLSDREAVDRFCYDNRWRYAAGVGGYDTCGRSSFAHTVLVDMRERLRRSADPDRIFTAALGVAKEAGLVGRKRALDSTPLYDAVATMDTVTLIRSAIRGLLKVADSELEAQLRAALSSGDDYACAAKPVIDWDDPAAREALIHGAATDAFGCLWVLDGRELADPVFAAARLVATVVGQDLAADQDWVFRIARGVAPDRVISTVDPEARHGHKTAARGFDGYKGHVAVDPDSEIITAATVTPGNVGDAAVAEDLIGDLLGGHPTAADDPSGADPSGGDGDPPATRPDERDQTDHDQSDSNVGTSDTGHGDTGHGDTGHGDTDTAGGSDAGDSDGAGTVYGDNAYGTGAFQQRLEDAGIDSKCKTQRPTAPGGMFGKDRFSVDLDQDTVTCPAGQTTPIRRDKHGGGTASFSSACNECPLRQQCTTAADGRTISVGPHEAALARARARQTDPDWQADYRATRPKVERKLAHLVRRKHGGRRARVRGLVKVDADFRLVAAATNLARLAALGVHWTNTGWVTATA
jgi:transposase